MQPEITMIPATRNIHTGITTTTFQKKRVAAYARVSTDSDEQLTSYTAQVDYYTNYIKSKPEWEYIDTYTDEGISGMMTKNRAGFNRMITDALSGKIDLIITKSVSRFARNTVDSLTAIRKLKEKHVEVYFEKENIYTLDSKGELLLTLMSSLAQEESRSLSQNVTWGQRKRFSDGKFSVAYKHFLGYRKGPDGMPEIVPEEAAVVKRIYGEYIKGGTLYSIIKGLEADGIKTPTGKDKWCKSTVISILKNEKYKGDALLQKSFTVDFLTKKHKINEGEVPQYYVTGSHPAIIDPAEWDLVQIEMDRRGKGNNEKRGKHSGSNHHHGMFSGRIICSDCGGMYGPKVWHSNQKNRKTVWQCNDKFKGEKKCTTPHLEESFIKECFQDVWRRLYEDRKIILNDLSKSTGGIGLEKLQEKAGEIESEMHAISDSMKECISLNASAAISEDEYRKRYDSLFEQYREMEGNLSKINDKISTARIDTASVSAFSKLLQRDDITAFDFDEMLWRIIIDQVVVKPDETVVFRVFGGIEFGYDID